MNELLNELNRSRNLMGLPLLFEVGDATLSLNYTQKDIPQPISGESYKIEVPTLPENFIFILSFYKQNLDKVIMNDDGPWDEVDDNNINNYGVYLSTEMFNDDINDVDSYFIDFGVIKNFEIGNNDFNINYDLLNLPRNLVFSIMGTITNILKNKIKENKNICYLVFPTTEKRLNLYQTYIKKQIPSVEYQKNKFWNIFKIREKDDVKIYDDWYFNEYMINFKRIINDLKLSDNIVNYMLGKNFLNEKNENIIYNRFYLNDVPVEDAIQQLKDEFQKQNG